MLAYTWQIDFNFAFPRLMAARTRLGCSRHESRNCRHRHGADPCRLEPIVSHRSAPQERVWADGFSSAWGPGAAFVPTPVVPRKEDTVAVRRAGAASQHAAIASVLELKKPAALYSQE